MYVACVGSALQIEMMCHNHQYNFPMECTYYLHPMSLRCILHTVYRVFCLVHLLHRAPIGMMTNRYNIHYILLLNMYHRHIVRIQYRDLRRNYIVLDIREDMANMVHTGLRDLQSL